MLNTKEVLFFGAIINSYVSHDEFASVNSVLRKHVYMEEEIKNLQTSRAHQRF